MNLLVKLTTLKDENAHKQHLIRHHTRHLWDVFGGKVETERNGGKTEQQCLRNAKQIHKYEEPAM